ncbi:MAG: AAA family ATPase [Bacteroidota bacterium]
MVHLDHFFTSRNKYPWKIIEGFLYFYWMKNGLVFGKFYPLHKGHLALCEFGRKHCDHLRIMICAEKHESIPGSIRLNWLREYAQDKSNVSIRLFEYDEANLPNTSVSSTSVSEIWSKVFIDQFPDTDVIFTSEPYGDFVAKFMGIRHLMFDQMRTLVPVSASMIRNNPWQHVHSLPDWVRPYFVSKVVLLGTESTGKSTLCQRLANHFATEYVAEVGREVVDVTEEARFEDLITIGRLHAQRIEAAMPKAARFLFIDTDIHITMSYARFLFGKDLPVSDDIFASNQAEVYFFLEKDAPFVQDGTRLEKAERDKLEDAHLQLLQEYGVNVQHIRGDWESRFQQMIQILSPSDSAHGTPDSQPGVRSDDPDQTQD